MGLRCLWNGHKWNGCKCEVCGAVNQESLSHIKWEPLDKDFCKCSACGKQRKHEFAYKAIDNKCVRYCRYCGYECLPGGEHKWVKCACTKCGKEKHNIVDCHCADCNKEFHTFVLISEENKSDYEDRFRWIDLLYRCEVCGKEKIEEKPC